MPARPVCTRPALALVGLALLTGGLCGCGGGASGTGVGTSHRHGRDIPVELSLRDTRGRLVEIADQRGGLCLVVVVTTYDGVSQAIIRELSLFAHRHLDTVVLAVLAQPDAQTFATLYEETFEPPYAVLYEEGETIQLGTSDLGPFDAVPAFYMLDAAGLVADEHVGWAPEERLEAMYRRAFERGGITTSETPPGETPPNDTTPSETTPSETAPTDPAPE